VLKERQLPTNGNFAVNSAKKHATENPGARFTKYLTTVLRLSYDNAKVTIDLRRTSNLQNILRKMQSFSSVGSTCKIVRLSENSVRKLLSILLGEILARLNDYRKSILR